MKKSSRRQAAAAPKIQIFLNGSNGSQDRNEKEIRGGKAKEEEK